MSPNELSQAPPPAVVCVSPKSSANVGSVARAMRNFGLSELILVDPRCSLDREAYRMAVHGEPVLDTAETVPDIASLESRFDSFIGTTGKTTIPSLGRPLRPDEMGDRLASLPTGHRSALLLGREDHGLYTRELQLCRWTVRIPNSPEYPSMNLAMAATVLFYETFRHREIPPLTHTRALAPHRELEGLFGHARDVLLSVGFLQANNPDRMLYTLRRILERAQLDSREVRIFRGMFQQVKWALLRSREEDRP